MEGESALTVLFSGREPVVASEDLAALAVTAEEPQRRWAVRFDGGDHGFSLTFEATGPPAEIEASEPAARAGGMQGHEQLCAVHGTVRIAGRELPLRGRGQRGHLRGEPDWERIGSTRSLAAWLDDGTGVALCAVRPAGGDGYEQEAVWAAVMGPAGALRVDDPRISTTYDDDGRQRRAGLELWIGSGDDWPRRGTGELICGSTLELGALRLDCAFLRWRLEGTAGVGRYDLLRRA